MIRSDAQRRAMFANMGSVGYRDNDFAFGLSSIFKAGIPTLNIGVDLLGDVFHGLPVIWGRSPIEHDVIGTRYRVPSMLAEDIWQRNIGDVFGI